MNKLICNIILIVGLMFSVTNTFAQEITELSFEQEGETIQIQYSLRDNNFRSNYYIEVYVSQDSGQTWQGPLKAVSGDVGGEQKLGSNKTITWNVLQEAIKISSNIKFKITATGDYLPALSFTDPRDGKTYKTVKIGNQLWMAENLDYNKSGESWCYNDTSRNGNIYGRLYDWETAKKICPAGWHLPSKSEFNILLQHYGGEGAAAYIALIENGPSGFNALFGGSRRSNGTFSGIGDDGLFWSSSEYDSRNAYYMYIDRKNNHILLNYSLERVGRSVRCVKD